MPETLHTVVSDAIAEELDYPDDETMNTAERAARGFEEADFASRAATAALWQVVVHIRDAFEGGDYGKSAAAKKAVFGIIELIEG